jgi:hypothetical protein
MYGSTITPSRDHAVQGARKIVEFPREKWRALPFDTAQGTGDVSGSP